MIRANCQNYSVYRRLLKIYMNFLVKNLDYVNIGKSIP